MIRAQPRSSDSSDTSDTSDLPAKPKANTAFAYLECRLCRCRHLHACMPAHDLVIAPHHAACPTPNLSHPTPASVWCPHHDSSTTAFVATRGARAWSKPVVYRLRHLIVTRCMMRQTWTPCRRSPPSFDSIWSHSISIQAPAPRLLAPRLLDCQHLVGYLVWVMAEKVRARGRKEVETCRCYVWQRADA